MPLSFAPLRIAPSTFNSSMIPPYQVFALSLRSQTKVDLSSIQTLLWTKMAAGSPPSSENCERAIFFPVSMGDTVDSDVVYVGTTRGLTRDDKTNYGLFQSV